MRKLPATMCVVLGVGAIFFSTAHLHAHEEATGVVKERMDAMKSLGQAVGAMADMIKGKIAYDGVLVKQGAQTIKTHAGDELTALFPEGSLDDHSEALPALWQDWVNFSDLAAKLQTSAAALEVVADSQEAFIPAFIDLTDTCTACHTKFREEQED